MKRTIKINDDLSKNKLLRSVDENRLMIDCAEVIFDFDECRFLEPFHVVLLACLIEECYQTGSKITLHRSTKNLALNEYLSGIRFFEYWEKDFDRTLFTQHQKMSNLCLWKLHPPMLSPYVVHAQQYFEQHFLKGKNVEPLNISLAELFNNIIDHSESPISGYTTSQFYPKQNKMRIAVCDFGVGMAAKINGYFNTIGKPPVSSQKALELAFSKAFSTKSSPRNRGFGLDNLMSIVRESGGILAVRTNDTMLKMENGEVNYFPIRHNFQGTHFDILLDAARFEEKEDEILNDNFGF